MLHVLQLGSIAIGLTDSLWHTLPPLPFASGSIEVVIPCLNSQDHWVRRPKTASAAISGDLISTFQTSKQVFLSMFFLKWFRVIKIEIRHVMLHELSALLLFSTGKSWRTCLFQVDWCRSFHETNQCTYQVKKLYLSCRTSLYGVMASKVQQVSTCQRSTWGQESCADHSRAHRRQCQCLKRQTQHYYILTASAFIVSTSLQSRVLVHPKWEYNNMQSSSYCITQL